MERPLYVLLDIVAQNIVFGATHATAFGQMTLKAPIEMRAREGVNIDSSLKVEAGTAEDAIFTVVAVDGSVDMDTGANGWILVESPCDWRAQDNIKMHSKTSIKFTSTKQDTFRASDGNLSVATNSGAIEVQSLTNWYAGQDISFKALDITFQGGDGSWLEARRLAEGM